MKRATPSLLFSPVYRAGQDVRQWCWRSTDTSLIAGGRRISPAARPYFGPFIECDILISPIQVSQVRPSSASQAQNIPSWYVSMNGKSQSIHSVRLHLTIATETDRTQQAIDPFTLPSTGWGVFLPVLFGGRFLLLFCQSKNRKDRAFESHDGCQLT